MSEPEEEKVYSVDLLTRVEGEGAFVLRTRGGEVAEAELRIFEAPRFFEAFLRGRGMEEVVDIVARICGICPVAYQMSGSRALEDALGLEVGGGLRKLRRLLYCGEWIESHGLHVFMLHLPDFLGYPSAVEMAATHKEWVERGLRIKKIGNQIVKVLGGRAIHPVSPRVGGFHRVPRPADLEPLRVPLAEALDEMEDALAFLAELPMPSLEQEYVYVALGGTGGDYPLEHGETVAISGRDEIPLSAFAEETVEHHVPHSNALQARLADGTPYLTGPMARLHHHAERLHSRAASAMSAIGLERSVTNPYRSILVRGVEIVHALAEAIDLIDAYAEPPAPYLEATPTESVGFGASEAPRGLLWHRYAIGDDGKVVEARIVPPTSQNQARIEADLLGLGGRLLSMPHAEATHLCEQLIRSYDPCISCATHFLDLRIEEAEAG